MNMMTPIHALQADADRASSRSGRGHWRGPVAVAASVAEDDQRASPLLVYPFVIVVSLLLWYALAELGVWTLRLLSAL